MWITMKPNGSLFGAVCWLVAFAFFLFTAITYHLPVAILAAVLTFLLAAYNVYFWFKNRKK